MAKLYILCGYPFAGKSTIAKALINRYSFVRIALDEIKSELGNEELQRAYDIYQGLIASNLKTEKDVITDTVAHRKEGRDALRKIAHENDAKAIILYVDTPLDVVKDRWMQNRIKKERADVTDKEFNDVINSFEVPGKDESVILISNDMNMEEVCKLIEA